MDTQGSIVGSDGLGLCGVQEWDNTLAWLACMIFSSLIGSWEQIARMVEMISSAVSYALGWK